jgi:mono/diheme cytochrome c family protein
MHVERRQVEGIGIRVVVVLALATTGLIGCRAEREPVSTSANPAASTDVQPALPRARPLTDRQFESTEARLERGRYLVEGVTHCFFCHSEIDWKTRGGPALPGTKGGGHHFVPEGLPFLVAPNITPDRETGAGTWSDDTLARAIREGIGHDGRALYSDPVDMPYRRLRYMSDEDVASVIVYLRSIPAVSHALPKSNLPLAVMERVKNYPEPITDPVPPPSSSDSVARGAYLATLGNCSGCHTPIDADEQPLPGMEFSGGLVLAGPWGRVVSKNITQDPSGIPFYDEALFIETIRTGTVRARELNSIMPWGYFRNLTDSDLRDLFAYLKTVQPVRHRVDNETPPTYCRVCKGTHGLGDRN